MVRLPGTSKGGKPLFGIPIEQLEEPSRVLKFTVTTDPKSNEPLPEDAENVQAKECVKRKQFLSTYKSV